MLRLRELFTSPGLYDPLFGAVPPGEQDRPGVSTASIPFAGLRPADGVFRISGVDPKETRWCSESRFH